MDTKGRIKEFLALKKIGQNRFAKDCGFSESLINNSKGSIGSEVLNKISSRYPELSMDWLITGKGETLKYIPRYNPNLLQHFTKAKGLIGILEKMKIYFSDQENSKDIKERNLKNHDEVISGKITKEVVKKYKWISFFVKDENRQILQPKMFDMYADLHKGGCIELKKDELLRKNQFINENDFCDVKYRHRFLNQEKNVREELEYKYYQWRDENEHRIIYNGDLCGINIDVDCIERIYLGCYFFEDIIKVGEFCDVLERKNIPLNLVYQLSLSGIGYISEIAPDRISPEISKTGLQVIKLLPYLSDKYLNQNGIMIPDERKIIYHKEESYYKKKYEEAFKEASDLKTKLLEAKDEIISLKDKLHAREKNTDAQENLDAIIA